MEKKSIELNRAHIIDEQFVRKVQSQDFPSPKSNTTAKAAGLTKGLCISIVGSQMISRHLDIITRQLRETGQSFYTIGSSGHEGNAAIAAQFRVTDMALLHYRSAAFMLQRSKKLNDPEDQEPPESLIQSAIRDQLLSFVAAKEDPIAGGRHKVLGSVPLYVPPQTSTVATQLPKSLGLAYSLNLAKELQLATYLPTDAVILCSFGDASLNHSTAQGALNALAWIVRHQWPMPLVFICEDNGLGVSVPTPPNWVAQNLKFRQEIEYLSCDALNFCDVYQAATQAEIIARQKRKPVFLHFKTVRLLGHAGSDIESQYHTQTEIEHMEADDPLLHSARILIDQGILSPQAILEQYEIIGKWVKTISLEVIQATKQSSAEEIMAAIIPPKRAATKIFLKPENETVASTVDKQTALKTMAQLINRVLSETLALYPNSLIFGEDVGKKGGVYRITADLQSKFGMRRVFDTLLDEQTILGLAIGMSMNGFLPIPEIQFLAFLHNAADMIRGEAATLPFFSSGQFTNPMLIRLPGLGYQKGFGGHFHNDNAIAFLREIPGIIVACPSNGEDAVKMFRECMRLVDEEQRVVIFLEPIALYRIKDLHQKEDGGWLRTYPPANETISFGTLGMFGAGSDLIILTYGNGYYLSRQAEQILWAQFQIEIKIVDLRWLTPLNQEAIVQVVKNYQHVLIVDEGRNRGSLSEEITTLLVENVTPLPKIRRITGENSFIPLGTASEAVLPSLEQIVVGARQMLEK